MAVHARRGARAISCTARSTPPADRAPRPPAAPYAHSERARAAVR
jgi:hypothetical protein